MARNGGDRFGAPGYGGTVAASDAALITAVQDGSDAAFGVLYDRYRPVALAGARRHLAAHNRSQAEDVVEITFASVHGALRRGHGPAGPFRSYLLLAIRREAARQQRHRNRESLTGSVPIELLTSGPEQVAASARWPTNLGPVAPVVSTPGERGIEPDLLVGEVFKGLNDRFRHVLWLSEVEGRSPEEIAPLFGVTPNAAAAVCYRARRALRSGYFGAYASTLAAPMCKPLIPKLASFVEAGQPAEGHDTVRNHLTGCSACRDVARGSVQSGSILGAMAPFGLLSAGAWLDPDRAPVAVPRKRVRARRVAQVAAAALVLVALAAAMSWSGGSPDPDSQDLADRAGRGSSGATDERDPGAGPARGDRAAAAPPTTTGAPTTAPTTQPPDPGRPPVGAPAEAPERAAAAAELPTLPAPADAEARRARGSISGRLAADRDGAGPGPLVPSQGTPIRVVTPGGIEVARAMADEAGAFRVGDLEPDRYQVLATLPVGFVVGGDPHPIGSASIRREVLVAAPDVVAGGDAPVTATFVPWRRLAIGGGASSAPTLGPGGEVSWTFALSSSRAATDDVVADVVFDQPVGSNLSIDVRWPGSTRACGGGGSGPTLAARCRLGSLTAQAVMVTVTLRMQSGIRHGLVAPRLTVASQSAAAEVATAAGRAVTAGP